VDDEERRWERDEARGIGRQRKVGREGERVRERGSESERERK